MKAIILAAGQGTRLNKYTRELPKGMLDINGKSIIERQIETYLSQGIDDITIIRGYMAEKIDFKGVKYYYNALYDQTNMVESLFCAANELNGDVIVSYADILFEKRILQAVMEFKEDIGVVVDGDWKDYWRERYGKVEFDIESLSYSKDGSIAELGISDPPIESIDGRYVGIICLSSNGSKVFCDTYNEAKNRYKGKPWLNGRLFEKIFMTDFLQELINQKNKVFPIIVQKGWLEFDTNEDYENYVKWSNEKTIFHFIKGLE